MLARALSEEGAPSLTENLGRFQIRIRVVFAFVLDSYEYG